MAAAQFIGKVCAKHPDAGGVRYVAQKVCVECLKETNARRAAAKKEWEAANRESVLQRKAKWREDNREAINAKAREASATLYAEKRAAYRAANRERARAYGETYRANNRSRQKELARAHYANNKAVYVARARSREQHISQKATPAWADKNELNRTYAQCPPGWHVDHIVPLRGKGVSGLHVPENLQYLPAQENYAKRNHYEG